MKQEFFNLEIKTSGQKLYEFTDHTDNWIKKNNFNNGIINLSYTAYKCIINCSGKCRS